MNYFGFGYLRPSRLQDNFTAVRQHFEIVRDSRSNMVRLGINKWAWDNNPLVAEGIPYRDHLVQVMTWTRELNLKVFLDMHFGTRNPADFTRVKKAEIIITPSLQADWINTFSDALYTLNPFAADLFNEPPPAKFSPIPMSNQEYFDIYRIFLENMVNAYRTIKSNLVISVESAPFWDMRYIAANPLNMPNILYSFHSYPSQIKGLNNGAVLLNAWDTDPDLAKSLWRDWILTPGHFAPLGGTGIGVQAIIDAGLTPYNMECGTTFYDTHWPEWMQYHYTLMAEELGIGYSQHQLIENPHITNRYGMLTLDGTALNDIGLTWIQGLPAMPTFPRIGFLPFALIGGLIYWMSKSVKRRG